VETVQLDLMSWSPPTETTDRLRPYQHEAVQTCLTALDAGASPVLMLPTGSGKSRVIAALCEVIPGRILVATHRQELLEQNAAQLCAYMDSPADYGLYSAGLGRRETANRVVFGGIQSIYRQMERLQRAGVFRTVIVDECHRIPPPSIVSMYGKVFAACEGAQRIGLTATPYRLDDGLLVHPEMDDTWFDAMPVQVGIRDLTPDWLSPLAGVLTAHDIDVSQVRTRAGDFVTSDLSQVACEESAVRGAVDELVALAAHRRKWLVFCVDVAHTRLVTLALQERGIQADLLLGDTSQEERAAVLQRFRAGHLHALVNCEVATTGFDIPDIDCVALLRPTQSKALVVQMLGRGTRQAPAKLDCLVLDFAGNLERHTPLDELQTVSKSPALEAREAEEDAAAERQRQAARARLAKHRERASLSDPMGETRAKETHTYTVTNMFYRVVNAKRYPGKQMVLIGYFCPDRRPQRNVPHYLCVEHDGWAREQSHGWFRRRGLPIPTTAAEGLRTIQRWRGVFPMQIVVEDGGEWPRVLMEHLDTNAEMPQSRTPWDLWRHDTADILA
jgi:DNA repair protein RadD